MPGAATGVANLQDRVGNRRITQNQSRFCGSRPISGHQSVPIFVL